MCGLEVVKFPHSVVMAMQKETFVLPCDCDFGEVNAVAWLRRLVAVEASVRSETSACGICGGQNGTATDFTPSTLISPLSLCINASYVFTADAV